MKKSWLGTAKSAEKARLLRLADVGKKEESFVGWRVFFGIQKDEFGHFRKEGLLALDNDWGVEFLFLGILRKLVLSCLLGSSTRFGTGFKED